jgi:hypothetical protein
VKRYSAADSEERMDVLIVSFVSGSTTSRAENWISLGMSVVAVASE